VEVINWSLAISSPRPEVSHLKDVPNTTPAVRSGTRKMFDSSLLKEIEVDEYLRRDLVPGSMIEGPAVIAEAETSTIVPASFDAVVGASGAIVLERRSAA